MIIHEDIEVMITADMTPTDLAVVTGPEIVVGAETVENVNVFGIRPLQTTLSARLTAVAIIMTTTRVKTRLMTSTTTMTAKRTATAVTGHTTTKTNAMKCPTIHS